VFAVTIAATAQQPAKTTARIMLQNMIETNAKFAAIDDKPSGEPRISYWTCHRGEAKPASPPPQGRGNR